MKSLLTLGIIMGLLFVMTGCTTITQPTDTNIISEDASSIRTVGVPICDNYLATLQCLGDSSTGSQQINFNASYNSLVQSFQNVPVEQLLQTCTTLANALREHPTLLKDYPKCNTL